MNRTTKAAAAVDPSPRAVVDFWRAAGDAGHWFDKDPAFDDVFRERFLALHLAAARGALAHWADEDDGLLALVILLDQYPRNAFRDTAHMYATDGQARRLARRALDRGVFDRIEPALRLFLCLPFAHSESLDDQDLSVELNGRLGSEARRHAEGHRDIVRRFGRFPHRNPLLGRDSTFEEQVFLDEGGFAG